MYKLGVDAGAASVKMVVLDDEGVEALRLRRMHHNNVRATLDDMLSQVASFLREAPSSHGSGSDRPAASGASGAKAGGMDSASVAASGASGAKAGGMDSASASAGTAESATAAGTDNVLATTAAAAAGSAAAESAIAGAGTTDVLAVAVTGTMSHLLDLEGDYEQADVVALATGLRAAAPEARSCISIGAMSSLYLQVAATGGQPVVRRNTNCSAGTGSFLQEQSGRLEIPLEDISATIGQATSIPHLAGRCSVFSKTDIIHHMQEGATVPDLLLGLCYAMVRNYRANILQNARPALPVALDGGTMRNAGVTRAIREVLDLNDEDVILDENADFYRAIGCAQLASRTADLDQLRAAATGGVASIAAGSASNENAIAYVSSKINPDAIECAPANGAPTTPIANTSGAGDVFGKNATADSAHGPRIASAGGSTTAALPPLARFAGPDDADLDAFFPVTPTPPVPTSASLGIDIGSASINIVLADRQGRVYRYVYLRNTGKPLEILQPALEEFRATIPDTIAIEHVAITGSGREYVGKAIGADFVINEITAQAAGAAAHNPQVDTIFEIGGQDSKYLSLEGGAVRDFEMNKVCAAGTGTFLEEQVRKLGLPMEAFMQKALASAHPCVLGDRCTVFIESGVTSQLAQGTPLEDICAGLAYAIASNYLHRVVNLKPIGDTIAIQGGIAFNEAVVCAFRALTGKPVTRSQFFSVTGALGAALLAFDAKSLVFDAARNQELNRQLAADTEASYLDGFDAAAPRDPGKKTVGIPRVVFLNKMFPLFKTMFTKLGYNVVLSPRSSAQTVRAAREYATEETCFPIKLIYGHISWLLDQGVDYIILPRLESVVHRGSKARVNYSCMYMQTSPLLMEAAFHFKERGVTLISPRLTLNFGKKYMIGALLTIANTLHILPPRMVPAAIAGVRALFAHSDRLETLAKDYMDTDEPVFVLMSRVYNIVDPVLNMGLERHLDAMGCRVIHLEHLEASFMNVAREYGNLYWPFGQHLLTGFQIIAQHDNLFPIYITNHGCGPDTAIQHYIKRMMAGKPYLHLEVDEHSSGIGVITRLEAYLYEVAQYRADHPETTSKFDVAAALQHAENCNGLGIDLSDILGAGRPHAHSDACGSCRTDAAHGQKIIPELGIYTELLAFTASESTAGQTAKAPSDEGAATMGGPSDIASGAAASNPAHANAATADAPASYKTSMLSGPSDVIVAAPTPHRANLNYAINKEYHSLLVSLEEVVNTCEVGLMGSCTLHFPTYEGAEVWGQYGRLITQELERRGITATLEAPFLEDYLQRPDLPQLFARMLEIERTCYAQALSEQAGGKRLVMAIGEPLCVYKQAIFESATAPLRLADGPCAVIPMPLSEALVLFWTDIDKKGAYAQALNALRAQLDAARATFPGIYTPWEQLLATANGYLSQCAGGFGRYRYAKLHCLGAHSARNGKAFAEGGGAPTKGKLPAEVEKEFAESGKAHAEGKLPAESVRASAEGKLPAEGAVDGVLLVNSAEENTSIVLRAIEQPALDLPVCRVDIDYSHTLSEEEARTFLHFME